MVYHLMVCISLKVQNAQQSGKASHVGPMWQMLTKCPATLAAQQEFAAQGKLWQCMHLKHMTKVGVTVFCRVAASMLYRYQL